MLGLRRKNIKGPVKNTPYRTCIACRKLKPKRELIRLMRTTEGTIQIDTEKGKTGRGSYLCATRECWQTGLKGSRLEHALRAMLTPDNREELARFSQGLKE